MAIDFKKLYESRIKEIDMQIKKAIQLKKWAVKKSLEEEKERLLAHISLIDKNNCCV